MIKIEYFTTVNDIPTIIWGKFVSRSAVGLEIGHLQAIEDSRINDINPYYLIGYQEGIPVGIAYCFAIQVNLAKIVNSYPPEVINTVKTWQPDFMEKRIIEVGHIASLGATIEVLQPFLTDFLDALTQKIDEIGQLENADLCIIRDIDVVHYHDFRRLEQYGYRPILGFPIARIPVTWNNFDGYIASLKAKKRNNILHRRDRLHSPEITVEIIEDYAPYSERLSELWKNVAIRNNGYNHENLTPAYFNSMSHHLKGRSHVLAIKQNGEIMAYGLNLIGDEEYFGVAEGLDYNFRDNYDLYANNIFEGLRIACEKEKKSFNIGITSYEFKTSIGAELFPCVYFVNALKYPQYCAVYADMIQKEIKQPENQHRVFRNQDNVNRFQLKNVEANLHKSDNTLDPFAKHKRYLRVDSVRAANLYAYCPEFESAQEPVIKHKGRNVIMLGTNSYLGLGTHSKVKDAARKAIDKYGTGCSGSPLLNGTLDLHNQLAFELAQFIRKEEALIFSTGYQTNVGIISTLVNRHDVLIMDERNHASLVDGAMLSRAEVVRYKHNDIESLEKVLQKYANKPKLVVTDSLFSMEGTIINLPQIVQLVNQYQARLMLDESHAIGVIGPTGRGVAEHFNLLRDVDIIMGTFSKSFASIGGFVAGESKIIDTLKHTARSHIFSASLPPASVAAVLAALRIIDEEPELRLKLRENARFMANGLRSLGYEIGHHESAIIPVFCGNELLTLAAFHKLFDEGVFVNPVTHPAVPRNKEMLRIGIMATHDESILFRALEVFKKVRTNNWPNYVKTIHDEKNGKLELKYTHYA